MASVAKRRKRAEKRAIVRKHGSDTGRTRPRFQLPVTLTYDGQSFTIVGTCGNRMSGNVGAINRVLTELGHAENMILEMIIATGYEPPKTRTTPINTSRRPNQQPKRRST